MKSMPSTTDAMADDPEEKTGVKSSKKEEYVRSTTPRAVRLMPSRLPFFGHALSYKKDPVAFLCMCRDTVGSVFAIDLAGLKTNVVCNRVAMKEVGISKTPHRRTARMLP